MASLQENSDGSNSLWGWFSSISDSFKSLWESIKEIPSAIGNTIKDIFVPDSEAIASSVNRLKDGIRTAFGVDALDISTVFGGSVAIDDSNHAADSYLGIDISGTSFLNTSWLKTSIQTFRPYIRGFIVLLLLLYNTNQFLAFIGAGTLSSLGSSLTSKGSKSPAKD